MSSSNDRHAPHSGMPDPLSMIEQEQISLLALCDRLEEIADALLDDLSPSTLETVAQEWRCRLPLHHQHMEKVLFPLLEKRAQSQDSIDEVISGFTHEQAMDDGYILGVLEVLDQFASGQPAGEHKPDYYEAAGYLLRGFFEALRRHLRWERFIVLRLARQRLTKEDLAEIYVRISAGTC